MKAALFVFNTCVVLLLIMSVMRMGERLRPEPIASMPGVGGESVHLTKVCIEGLWEECIDLPEGGTFQVGVIGPNGLTNEKILIIKQQR